MPPPPPPPPPLPMEDDDLRHRHHHHNQQQHHQHQQQQQHPHGSAAAGGSHGPSSDPPVTTTATTTTTTTQPPPPPPPQHHHLSLSLPLHLPSSSNSPRLLPLPSSKPPSLPDHPPPPDRHSRDDCWSEGATNTLIDAWGDRYLELNRGNLKQKHWKDVADSVNGREDGHKVPKTDVQCKNRLDTLKKKYKLEKSKIVTGGGPSKWPFFERLDELIGPSKKPKKSTPVKLRPPLLTGKRPLDELEQKPIFNNVVANNLASTADTISKSKESPDMTDSCPHGLNNTADGKSFKRKRLHESPFKDLARAILKFGEVYERIETAKQQQMMDLEKQRMEFTKDLELQRMQLFMQTQVELAKMKHSKHGSTEHYL